MRLLESGDIERRMMIMYKNATHVLYRSDFKDESFWEGMLEAHGITDVDDVDEITIRATVETVE